MYALAIDGELVSAKLTAKEVQKNLRVKGDGEAKIEIASFDPSKRLWIPVCLETFSKAA